MGIIKDFINYLIGDCETCKYEKDCPYIEERKGSCFEIGGDLIHIMKRKKR